MPLPVTDVERELRHTRRVRYEGYSAPTGCGHRGHLTDIKSHDNPMKTGVRRAGQPIHEMWLRLTIDRHFTILDAVAASDAVPYPGGCENIAPAYKRLIGLNLVRDFRRSVKKLFGDGGCTHITEMLTGFPTAAIQTFAGEMPEERPTAASLSSSTSATRSTRAPRPSGAGIRSGTARKRPRLMKIHEYQGKEIFRKYGVATPRGFPPSASTRRSMAKKLGGKVWVVKAQIHAGGRGKGGGVKVAKSLDEVRNLRKRSWA